MGTSKKETKRKAGSLSPNKNLKEIRATGRQSSERPSCNACSPKVQRFPSSQAATGKSLHPNSFHACPPPLPLSHTNFPLPPPTRCFYGFQTFTNQKHLAGPNKTLQGLEGILSCGGEGKAKGDDAASQPAGESAQNHHVRTVLTNTAEVRIRRSVSLASRPT